MFLLPKNTIAKNTYYSSTTSKDYTQTLFLKKPTLILKYNNFILKNMFKILYIKTTNENKYTDIEKKSSQQQSNKFSFKLKSD